MNWIPHTYEEKIFRPDEGLSLPEDVVHYVFGRRMPPIRVLRGMKLISLVGSARKVGGFKMPGIKGREYFWRKAWIEFKTPNAQGVYCIRNREGRVLYVGKGNLRERLLSHWYKENSVDPPIWAGGPRSFSFEVTDNPNERHAALLKELKTAQICAA